MDVGAYLHRIGIHDVPTVSVKSLKLLQQQHLRTVPFENLDVWARRGVSVEVTKSVAKIVDGGRGGWCFEVNGAFGWLLGQLGFEVRMLGAAVLLNGPSRVIDHLCLEVMLDEAYLVDVGFGAQGAVVPLLLGARGSIATPTGEYELIASSEGTTLTILDGSVPKPLYRFKRVAHQLEEFAAVSASMQADEDSHWCQAPFATRMLDTDGSRVTLRAGKLTLTDSAGVATATAVATSEWTNHLREHFGLVEECSPSDLNW